MQAGVLALLCCAALAASAATTPTPAVSHAQADTAYARKDWPAAARGYKSVTQAEPANARAWFRLGVAYGSQGRWDKAIVAYRTADGFGRIPPAFSRYNLACAFARAGLVDSSVARLQSLVAAGYTQVDQMQNDPDLAAVRADARYAAILERARHNATPCSDRPESRQFDFWIGDWNVTSNVNAGVQVGKSHVELILGQCVIFENWTASPGSGKSFNAWNADLGCWQQNWMDELGDVTNYTDGHFTEGAMRFHARKKTAAGVLQEHKLTFFPLGPDEVRQLGEHSEDGGATFKVDYDLDYRRVR